MRESLPYQEEPWVSFETSASESAPDLSDREFLTEEEKRILVGEIRAGLDAQETLKNDEHRTDRMNLEAVVSAGCRAEELMVQTHIRLAMKIANAHYATSMSPDDLLQHAEIGLLKAARTFDPSSEVEFKKYAGGCIRKEVRKGIANTDRFIDIPENEFWLARKIPGAQEEFMQKHGRVASDEELAEILNARVTQITDLRPMVNDALAILDAPLGDDLSLTLMDRLTDEESLHNVGDHDDISDPRLKAALDKLPEPKRKFVLMRYGLEGHPNMNPEDISEEMGIAPESVPKAEERIRRHLRVIMESDMEGTAGSSDGGEEIPEDLGVLSEREKREYDPLANPLLNIRDGAWLTNLTGKPPAAEFFQEANEIILAGSDDLRGVNEVGPTNKALVSNNLAARRRFFEMLGMTDEHHPLHKSFNEFAGGRRRLPRLDQFVLTQRAFAMHKINPARVLKALPRSAYFRPDAVFPALEVLRGAGLREDRIIYSEPELSVFEPERIRQTIDVLNNKGMDIARLETESHVFMHDPSEIEKNIQNLEQQRFDVIQIGKRKLMVFTERRDTINIIIAEMTELGLDMQYIAPRFPTILVSKPATIRRKLEGIDTMGLNWRVLVRKQPSLLGADTATLEKRVILLHRIASTLGWEGNVNEIIEAKPGVLQDAQSKLFFLAYVAAQHLAPDARSSISARHVADATTIPVASHLLATSRPNEPYSISMARRYQRGIKAEARSSAAEKALQDPVATKRIGDKVIRAYDRHLSIKN